MKSQPISPRQHAVMDYVLAGSLLILPHVFKLNKKVRAIYAAEALVLLPYIAFTRQPASIKNIIPFKTHGKIDPFNIGQFALQTFTEPFRKDRKSLYFNIVFTAIAGATVLLTKFKK